MYDVGYGGTAALLAVLFAVRLRNLVRYPSDLAARAVCVAFGSTAAAFAFAAPAVYLVFDRAVGVPNLATLGVYLDILLTSGGVVAVMASWTGRPAPRIRAWIVGYAALIAVLLTLFLVYRADGAEHPVDFDAAYAARPGIREFLLLYYVGFALSMAATAWLGLRYSRMAGRSWLARGLRLTAVGAAFALGYCLLKVVAVVGITAGAAVQPLTTVWAPVSATVGALLIAVGITASARGPAVSEFVGRAVAYARLYGLWRALTSVQESVVLEPRPVSWLTAWTRRWSLLDSRHRLYRRAVEIHDARLALAPYLDPRAADALGLVAARFGDDDRRLRAAREAAMLAHAVRLTARGAPPPLPVQPPPDDTGGAWDEQLRWLLLVAREFRRLPAPGR